MSLTSSLSGQLLRLRALPALCGAESHGFCSFYCFLRRLRAADIFLPTTKICRAAGPDGHPWQPSSNPIGVWILSSKGLRRAATDSGGSANRQGRPPPDLAALRRNFRLGRTAACPWPHRTPPWANCQTPSCIGSEAGDANTEAVILAPHACGRSVAIGVCALFWGFSLPGWPGISWCVRIYVCCRRFFLRAAGYIAMRLLDFLPSSPARSVRACVHSKGRD